MKQITRFMALGVAFLSIISCDIKEVEFASGKPAVPKMSAYFGNAPYIPDIETFMQIGWAGDPGLSPDGKRILFSTSLSDVTQLYRLTDSGWPYQLTTFPDGIDWYVLSHSANLAIVGASIGGSEQSQLFLVDTYTGRAKQLTNAPDVQYGSVVWSRDDKYIYFRSNIENKRDFKLYKMELITGQTQKLVDTEGWNGWADVSPTGSKLVYYCAHSTVNNDLYLYDAVTGKVENLTSHEGDITYDGGLFSADETRLYITCNNNDRGISLRATLDLSSKEISFLDSDSPWNVDGITLSPDRKVMAWIINEDGYARLKLSEIETGRELPIPNLDGIIGGVILSETSKMVLTFNSPTQTTDVWCWDWETQQLVRLTQSTYAGIDNSNFAEPQLVKYSSYDGLEIPAFLYLPVNYKDGPIPFIVEVHGGPEGQFRPDFNRHFQYLMLHGFGIFAPNVRGSDGYGKDYLAMDNYKNRLNSVKDLKAGADWLISHGYSRQGMIGIKGASYGGYMTMAAITEFPGFFSAAINSVGIVNFVTFLENTSAYRQQLRESEYGPLSDTVFLKSISPIYKANLIATPLMVAHGENDPRVPVGEARQIIKAIEAKGGVVEPLIFPDEGHGINKLKNRLVFYRKMVEFFEKYLKKNQSLTQ